MSRRPSISHNGAGDSLNGSAKKTSKKKVPSDDSLGPRKRKKQVNYFESSDSNSASEDETEDVKVVPPVRKRGRPRKSETNDTPVSEAAQIEDTTSVTPKRRGRKKKEVIIVEDEAPLVKNTRGMKEKVKVDAEPETHKKIRKIMDDKQISEKTKTAQAEENERRKRLMERQNKYNEEILEAAKKSGDLSAVPQQLVLECDENGKPLIEVCHSIVKQLKAHQIEAVKFLWDCVFESLEAHNKGLAEEKEDPSASGGSGAILAHCMGLGKTLSTIAFLHTVLHNRSLLHLRSALIVCPINAVLNWHREWDMWQPADQALPIQTLSNKLEPKERLEVIRKWQSKGGILLMGYDMFRLLAQCNRIRRKVDKSLVQEGLLSPGPDLVVCDEGHLLKNEAGLLSQTIRQIRSKRRIVLTGTPLQNNLLEYYTMVNFVKPQLLGTKQEFRNRFVNPITNGQHSSSTPHDVQLMKMRAHVLYKMLDGCVQRRDYSSLTKYLPPKLEYLVRIRLTDVQRELYRRYLDIREEATAPEEKLTSAGLFADQQMLYRIWTHPFTLKMHEKRETKKALMRFVNEEDEDEEDEEVSYDEGADDSDSLNEGVSFSEDGPKKETRTSRKKKEKIDDAFEEEDTTTGESNDDDDEEEENDDEDDDEQPETDESDEESSTKNGHVSPQKSTSRPAQHRWRTRSRGKAKAKDTTGDEQQDVSEEEVGVGLGERVEPAWWHDLYEENFESRPELSGKLMMLFHMLRKFADVGDKVLLFSQSLYSLDIIERYLREMHTHLNPAEVKPEATTEPTEEKPTDGAATATTPQYDYSPFKSDIGPNTWVRGLDYDRIDGSTAIHLRKNIQDRFNDPNDFRFRLFLISTKAGGLGINLVAANRCIVFDVSWNPSHDIQSIFRCYRFGQTKPVYIYRLAAQGTMEEKIYDRQITKQSLAHRVVDEHQIQRHFTAADLRALYCFEPDIYDPEAPRELPKLPKDRLLADLLLECRDLIVTYHDHDTLLENKVEEELTEQERQEAWQQYEEERRVGYVVLNATTREARQLFANYGNGASTSQATSSLQQMMSGTGGNMPLLPASNFVLVPPGMTEEQAQALYTNVALHVYNNYPSLRDMPTQMAQLMGQHYQQIVMQFLNQQTVGHNSATG